MHAKRKILITGIFWKSVSNWAMLFCLLLPLSCARLQKFNEKTYYNHAVKKLESISAGLSECPDEFSFPPPSFIAVRPNHLAPNRALYNRNNQTIIYEVDDVEVLWHEAVHHLAFTEKWSKSCMEQMLAVVLERYLSAELNLMMRRRMERK